LKLEDGQIFQDKKELEHFVMIMLAMNFMYFFMCNNDRIVNLRSIYLPKYYVQYHNITKMSGLLSLCNVQLYKRFTIFIKKVTALL
jgi:hypothetical protein